MVSFKKINSFFRNVYNKSLFASNTATCMVLLGAGDCFTQYVEQKTVGLNSTAQVITAVKQQQLQQTQMNLTATSTNIFNVDWERSKKMFIIGTAVGPLQHVWYTFLDKKFPKKTRSVIFKKVILDQIFCAPTLNLVLIAGVHLLEGERLNTLKDAVKEKFLTLYAVRFFVFFLFKGE
jgi:hypothetical protein